VVLIQVATSTTENDDLASTVSEIVTRIDAVHSTLAHNPLVFLRQDIAFSQYLALLTVADALMITSLREGMNLTCHEFVICQDGKASDKKHGPVILSEFTGSAAIFDGAELGVNPWDYQKCAEAIKVALEMGEAEKERRYAKMRDVVMRNTGDYWTRMLAEHLAIVHEEHYRRDNMSIPRLNVAKLCQTYEACPKRLLFIDYEGTLAHFGSVNNTVLSNNIERVTDCLNEIISNDNNTVYVMGGRTLEELETVFGRVPGIGLIAENGCYYREMYTDEWIAFVDEDKTKKWKDAVKNILQYYVERVEGSSIEERHCSLTFHYKKSDGYDSADRQAGDCANHINDACENQRVKAIPTKNSVIIEPMDLDKGTAAKHIFNSIPKEKRPDWLMVAGNDRDDEVIFRWANQLHEAGEVKEVSTVSVSNRNTVAMSTLTQGTTGKPHHSNNFETFANRIAGFVNVLSKLAKLS
jgi:trehalose 6-phosphate synthase/phosphatase